jgi:hypothetical protein
LLMHLYLYCVSHVKLFRSLLNEQNRLIVPFKSWPQFPSLPFVERIWHFLKFFDFKCVFLPFWTFVYKMLMFLKLLLNWIIQILILFTIKYAFKHLSFSSSIVYSECQQTRPNQILNKKWPLEAWLHTTNTLDDFFCYEHLRCNNY